MVGPKCACTVSSGLFRPIHLPQRRICEFSRNHRPSSSGGCTACDCHNSIAVKRKRNTSRKQLHRTPAADHSRMRRLLCLALLLTTITTQSAWSQAQSSGSEPTPKPAVEALLSAFDKYEIVAMPISHGQKDLDDFVLSLIRNPRFPSVANDVAVECRIMYQPILDRYIGGEECAVCRGTRSREHDPRAPLRDYGFYEVFFPLVRAINQQLRQRSDFVFSLLILRSTGIRSRRRRVSKGLTKRSTGR